MNNNEEPESLTNINEIFEKIATLGLSSLTKEELELIEKSTD
jgi:hypothetical protein